jgi:hypothetical protein
MAISYRVASNYKLIGVIHLEVLVAADNYDRAVPSTEAFSLADEIFIKLAAARLKFPLLQ